MNETDIYATLRYLQDNDTAVGLPLDDNASLVTQATVDCDPRLCSVLRSLAHTRVVIPKVLIPIVVIFGLFGNISSIIVLTRRWMITSTNLYLTALAVYDTLYLVFATTMTFKHYTSVKDQPWYSYYHIVGRPLVDVFSNTAVWLTLTFTIERWFCVCHPLKGRVWCTPSRARYIIGIVCVSVAVLTFPEFFQFRVDKRTGIDGKVKLTENSTAFGRSFGFTRVYININQTLFTFIPLVLLMVFNILLIKMVIEAAKQRSKLVHQTSQNQKTERQQKEQNKVTITLISVVVVFIMCHSPQAVHNIYGYYMKGTQSLTVYKRSVLTITANIFNLLVIINASINFVLYSTFNTKFRKTFKKISLRTYRRLYNRHSGNTGRHGLDASFDKDLNDIRMTQATTGVSRITYSRENIHVLAKSREELNNLIVSNKQAAKNGVSPVARQKNFR